MHEQWQEDDNEPGDESIASEWPEHVAAIAAAGAVLGGPASDADDASDFDDSEPMLLGLGFTQRRILRSLADSVVPPEELDPRAPMTAPRQGRTYGRYLEGTLREEAGGTWRASRPVSPLDGGSAGPGAGFDDVVHLVVEAIPTMANLAGAATFLVGAWRVLKRLTGSPPFVNEDSAAALAAVGITKQGGDGSAPLAFSVPIKGLPAEDYAVQGFAVGYRERERMWFAVVTLQGAVLGISAMPIDGRFVHEQPSDRYWLGPKASRKKSRKSRNDKSKNDPRPSPRRKS